MTDSVNSEGAPAPDANVSPEVAVEADANTPTTGNEAGSSPAAKDTSDSDVTEKVRSRIDELTKHRRDAERERDYWRDEALRRQAQPEPEKSAPVEATPKTLADFEYDEAKYQAYLFEQTEKRATAAAERKLKEAQERETTSRRQSEFAAREREFVKSTPDYYEVTRSAGLSITQAMVDAAAESEEAAAVLYHLGKNPDVADRIARLSPLAAAREIGRVEARLIAEREKAKPATVSKAPPPTPKIEGAGDPAVSKDPSEMTDAEFRKWRQRQIAQRR